MQEKIKTNTFFEHELAFYQVSLIESRKASVILEVKIIFIFFYLKGVANTFAKSYANIIFKNRLIKTCISAIEWLNQRFASEVKFLYINSKW
jgi:hypothetical protein